MNILHIAPFYPSVNAIHAGGVTMGHEIETLKKLGHKVYCLSYVQKKYDYSLFEKQHTGDDNKIDLSRKKKIENVILHFNVPFYFGTRLNGNFLSKIEKIIEKYKIDCIHAEYSPMIWYVQIKKKYPYIKFIGVLHDVNIQAYDRRILESRNFLKKYYYKIEKNKCLAFGKKYLPRCDEILSFSSKDQNLIKRYYGIKSEVINTFFNLDEIQKLRNKIHREKDGYYSICFIGQMGRKENNESALRLIRIFDQLHIEKKKLYIIGAHPNEELKNKASKDIIITGFVQNIDKYVLVHCDVACFPLTMGAGIKIKVLESLALGLPVITNSIGAEGIDEKGKYIRLAETDSEFIDALEENKNKRSDNIDQFEKDFSWNKTESVFKRIYGSNNK